MNITLDEEVYQGLHNHVPRRKMSSFIESLLRPHVIESDDELRKSYRAMSEDQAREKEAQEWCEGLLREPTDD